MATPSGVIQMDNTLFPVEVVVVFGKREIVGKLLFQRTRRGVDADKARALLHRHEAAASQRGEPNWITAAAKGFRRLPRRHETSGLRIEPFQSFAANVGHPKFAVRRKVDGKRRAGNDEPILAAGLPDETAGRHIMGADGLLFPIDAEAERTQLRVGWKYRRIGQGERLFRRNRAKTRFASEKKRAENPEGE